MGCRVHQRRLPVATFSENLLLIEPTPGDPATNNVWGTQLNTDFTLIDSAITGILDLSIAGSGITVLTSVQGQPDQSRNVTFNLTGALTGNSTVLWPQGLARNFVVNNQTTGAFTLTIGANNGMGAAAGTTSVVLQGGGPIALASDGTNVAQWFGGFLPLTGGTLSNPTTTSLALNSTAVSLRALLYQTNLLDRWAIVTNNGAESGANAGSNLQIQNFNDAGSLIGNVVTINRATSVAAFNTIPTFPTASTGDDSTNGATTAYVINEITAFTSANYLPLTGGTITGNLTVGNGLGAPILKIDGGAGQNRNLDFTTTGTLRWDIAVNNVAETGGGAGSNLNINRFGDAGAFLGTAFSINRATGIVAVGVTPAITDNSNNVATTAFVQGAIPISVTSLTPVAGTGSLVTISTITLTAAATTYLLDAQITQTFGGSATNWAMKFVVNGFNVNSILTSIPQNAVSLKAVVTLTAGSNTITLQWLGQNSNVNMVFATLSVALTN
jgi:hypothetical protein